MIIYDLICVCGYQFEGWFNDRSDYEDQFQKSLLECHQCGSCAIHKILSPVAHLNSTVARTKTTLSTKKTADMPSEHEVKAFIEAVSTYVCKNYEDVGTNLAEKALKMHYGVDEEKKIRGIVTAQEEKMLADEGISLVKIPLPIKEKEDEN